MTRRAFLSGLAAPVERADGHRVYSFPSEPTIWEPRLLAGDEAKEYIHRRILERLQPAIIAGIQVPEWVKPGTVRIVKIGPNAWQRDGKPVDVVYSWKVPT